MSFLPAGDTEWVQANINRPLWNGDRLWVAAGARAEMQIGNATLRLASGTSVSVVNFDDRIAQFEVTQGAVHLHVREIQSGDTVEVDTPNLAFTINQPGDYRVDVTADADATSVAVNRGQAEVFGTQNAFVISAGTRYRFQGTDLAVYQPEPVARRDALDVWAAERLQLEERSTSARYVSPEVIGYADLDTNGDWREVPNYGTVWIPSRVASDWAPYRYGHWAWVDPWGWTWVDDASWGFAPFHYGRWAFVESRWCWVPGPRADRAVYAPALVAFVGGSNFSLSISTGPTAAVAWFPLAPGEVYRPAYAASREYFTRVNVTNTVVNVTNVTNIYNNPTRTDIKYTNVNNVNAVTAVPTQAFVDARPVQRAAVKMDPRVLQQAQVIPQAPLVPARASIVGAAPAAQMRPPAAAVERQVIAKQAPPPPPPSIQQREDVLKRQPGKPLDAAELRKLGEQSGAPRPQAKVVQPAAPPKPIAPAASAPVTTGTEKQPPSPPKAEEKGPPPRPEERGGPRVIPPPAPMESRPTNVPGPRATPPGTTGAEKQPSPPAKAEEKGPPPRPEERGGPRAIPPPAPMESRPANVPGPRATPTETPRPPQSVPPRPEPSPTVQPPAPREPPQRQGPPAKEVERPVTPPPPSARPPTVTPAAQPPAPPPRPEPANVQRPPAKEVERPVTPPPPPARPPTVTPAAQPPTPPPPPPRPPTPPPAAAQPPAPPATQATPPAPPAARPTPPPPTAGRPADKGPPPKEGDKKDDKKEKEKDKDKQ